MRRPRWMALAAGMALAGALISGLHVGRDALISGLLLVHITRPLQLGLLHRLTDPPSRESVTFPGGERTMAATLYRPPAGPGGAAVILIHGVNEQGKDDPRIVWLADLLARAGFTVLTPDFLGFKSLTLRTSDVEELVASVQYLAARSGGGGSARVGLIGFSYGAGPALVAAADVRVRDRVRFVVSFGGYYDLVNVITFITTGHYEFEGIRGSAVPNEYSRWIFLRYNLDLIPATRDREILRRIAEVKAKDPAADTAPLAATLGPAGRPVYALLTNRDPQRVEVLLAGLGPGTRERIRFLSPARVVQDLRARLFVVHNDPDEYLPHTESLRLAAALAHRGSVHLAITRVFQHVRPNFPELGVTSAVRTYLPEGWKLFHLIYDILRQRRAA